MVIRFTTRATAEVAIDGYSEGYNNDRPLLYTVNPLGPIVHIGLSVLCR